MMNRITLPDFLDLVKVLKMLYGRNVAENFFKKNLRLFVDVEYYDAFFGDNSNSV